MPHADFVHLRVHSAYSLSEGAIRIKELAALCREHRMPAVAVTDSGNLFGALEFALAVAEAGVQPIIGCVLALARREDTSNGRVGAAAAAAATDQLVLLVQSEVGYRNLMALVSHAFLAGDPGAPPQVAWSDLEAHTEGLIALTGGPAGPVGRLLAAGQATAAEQALLDLARLFPGRLYVELMRHGPDHLDGVEERIEPGLLDLAYAHDVPLVATNDAYFPSEDMYEAHDALLCIADGTYVGEPNRRRLTRHHWFKPAAAMRTLFADLPEAVDNTLAIARRCHFMPETRKPILPHFSTSAGRSEADELRVRASEGLERRLEAQVLSAVMDEQEREQTARPYRDRLRFELDVIERMGFPGYFLIVADFIQWAKGEGIPVGPGRGSGAGSVASWALTITDLDPLRFGLLFERFLNPERVSMPDFDIDFCQDRRDEVIAYVQDHYGHDRVAQIITFGKLQARAVLRDVGRVLQMPYGQVDRICKLVPNNPAKPTTLQQALDTVEQLREERERDPAVAYMVDTALKLEGLYRHASTHAAGVVISDRPLQELVALYRDPRSPMPVTQFNMKYVELAGLMKFDFLGLKTLTVLAKAAELIHAVRGTPVDLAAIPLDDPATFEMLGRGDTVGVFQLESTGMRDVLRRMKPNRFEDIIALVALYRPGPMDNIPSYVKVKNGEQAPDYLHPSLEPILKETFGIMVYQEQVMQVAQVLAGYSLGAADVLRRAMGKKIKSEMDAQKRHFVDGAVARGLPEDQAAMIFDQVEKFAGYGFNKSHAAAYALVAYQTAFLKANYAVEFLAASMTYDLGNTDKLDTFRQELKRLDIPLLPPDINRSAADFAVETLEPAANGVRYALGAVKGVGVEAMRSLVAERDAHGVFCSLADFAGRIDAGAVNRRQLENLIRGGAFDGLEPNRARLLHGADRLVRQAHAAAEERASNQVNLFGDTEGPAFGEVDLPAVEDWDVLERMRQEFEAIGFHLSAHPIDSYPVKRLGVEPFAGLEKRLRPGSSTKTKLAGIVMARRERLSKADRRFAFVTVSDATGVFDVLMFSEVLAKFRHLLEPNTPVLLSIEAEALTDGGLRLTCQALEALEEAVARVDSAMHVFVESAAAVPHLKAQLGRFGQGRNPVTLFLRLEPSREVEIDLAGRYAVGPRGKAALKAIGGVAEVLEV